MNERREMYKSYWAFEAEKWTEIDSAGIWTSNLSM